MGFVFLATTLEILSAAPEERLGRGRRTQITCGLMIWRSPHGARQATATAECGGRVYAGVPGYPGSAQHQRRASSLNAPVASLDPWDA